VLDMTDAPNRQLHEANRLSWNAVTDAHNSHKTDQAGYFSRGGCKLYPEERELLGDVRGRDVLHLQCNCGQDTLSIANLGAAHVTGIDISNTAIDFARQLARDAGVTNAKFLRSDLYDWFDHASRDAAEGFDIAFSSYGAICWLSDLRAWARGVASILKPGGRLALVDYHPASQMFDGALQRKYDYFAEGRVLTWPNGICDYVAETGTSPYGEFLPGVRDFKNPHPVHEFQWAIGEIVTAILDAGLALTTLKEFPYANGNKAFESMRNIGGDRWALPPESANIPLMYAVSAQKPA
jgi:SAM-dependent methyltransferase